MKTVVDEAGCIQLPEDVRTQLGVKAGDEVVLEKRASEWVLKAADRRTGLAWEGNVLVHLGTSATVGDIIDEAGNFDEFASVLGLIGRDA